MSRPVGQINEALAGFTDIQELSLGRFDLVLGHVELAEQEVEVRLFGIELDQFFHAFPGFVVLLFSVVHADQLFDGGKVIRGHVVGAGMGHVIGSERGSWSGMRSGGVVFPRG